MNSRKMNCSSSQVKFCGVCHKAGKPASEYESHYTKSKPGPDGVVVCPIILAAVCQRCNKTGHFTDHCKMKLKDEGASKRTPERSSYPCRKPTAVASAASNNRFAVLSCFDNDDDDVVLKKRRKLSDEPIPTIDHKLSVGPKLSVEKEIESRAPNGISFAAMLLKPVPVPIASAASITSAASAPLQNLSFKISPKLQSVLESDFERSYEKRLLAEKFVSDRIQRRWFDCGVDDSDYIDKSAW